jgi:hypothetical protein
MPTQSVRRARFLGGKPVLIDILNTEQTERGLNKGQIILIICYGNPKLNRRQLYEKVVPMREDMTERIQTTVDMASAAQRALMVCDFTASIRNLWPWRNAICTPSLPPAATSAPTLPTKSYECQPLIYHRSTKSMSQTLKLQCLST